MRYPAAFSGVGKPLDELLWAHVTFKKRVREALVEPEGTADIQPVVETALLTAELAARIVHDRRVVEEVLRAAKRIVGPERDVSRGGLSVLSRRVTELVGRVVEESLRGLR